MQAQDFSTLRQQLIDELQKIAKVSFFKSDGTTDVGSFPPFVSG